MRRHSSRWVTSCIVGRPKAFTAGWSSPTATLIAPSTLLELYPEPDRWWSARSTTTDLVLIRPLMGDHTLGLRPYAWADHYAALRRALDAVAAVLREQGHRAIVVADENSLVDRAAAHRAGIGWWGKSANVLIPGIGSMVVLGSVITDAVISGDTPEVADECGTCRKCLDGCPTGAFVAPGVIDARRCLAWLVQQDGVFEPEYREALGDRLYGCDDCQDVCPPNSVRLRRPAAATDGEPWVDVLAVLAASDEQLIERFGRWYIPNREPRYLRRNALVVLGNIGDPGNPSVVAAVNAALADPDPLIRSHAVWCARRLGLSLDALVGADHPMVATELQGSSRQ